MQQRKLEARGRRQDEIHDDVVGFGEGVFDDLKIETNAELDGSRVGLGECAVVVAAAAAEAMAGGGEGETGADEGVDFWDRNGGRFFVRLKDAEGARSECATAVEAEVLTGDSGVEPGELRVGEDDGGEIQLTRKR
jgi:hypothetical protein